jgi:hypothetical protein
MIPIIEIVEPAMAEILGGRTEAEGLAFAWGMWGSARAMLANLLRAEHPHWSTEKTNREIARRFKGDALDRGYINEWAARGLSDIWQQGQEREATA